MSGYEKNFPVTWEELHRNAKALAWRLNSLGVFKGIIAVTRGGLVPAAVVARELEIRMIDTICISSYEGDKQEDLNVIKDVKLDNDGEGCLIIDDLVDSGDTAKIVKDMMPNSKFVVLYAKTSGKKQADLHLYDFKDKDWLVFPWEQD